MILIDPSLTSTPTNDNNNHPDSHHHNDNDGADDHHHKPNPTTGPTITAGEQDTRTHVVGELYDTEKSYVESLQILVNVSQIFHHHHPRRLHFFSIDWLIDWPWLIVPPVQKYMRPLKSPEYSGLVESILVDEMFYQIPEILHHHEAFLERLESRLNSWDSKQKVGDLLSEAVSRFVLPLPNATRLRLDLWLFFYCLIHMHSHSLLNSQSLTLTRRSSTIGRMRGKQSIWQRRPSLPSPNSLR